jgi:flagellar protein FliL
MADVPVLAPADEVAPVKSRKWLIISVCAVLLVGGSLGAWILLRPATHAAADKASAPPAPAQYVALDPPFVVNFAGDQTVRFLQVSVQIMTRDPATVELLKGNDPVIRNDLLLLLSNQKYSVVATRDGKEHLRSDALAAVRHVISAAGGKPERVEQILFTSFVMQ